MEYEEQESIEKRNIIDSMVRMLVKSEQFKKDATKFLELNYNDINLDDDDECADVIGLAIFDGHLSEFANINSISEDKLKTFIKENIEDANIAFPEFIGYSYVEIGQKILNYIIKERKWEVELEVEDHFYINI